MDSFWGPVFTLGPSVLVLMNMVTLCCCCYCGLIDGTEIKVMGRFLLCLFFSVSVWLLGALHGTVWV